MKKVLLTALIFITAKSFAQTWVQVPDVNFQNYLTSHYPAAAFMTSGSDFFIDADNADIQSVSNLDISNNSISSIDGVQAFTNLSSLQCNNNTLTSISFLPSNLFSLVCNDNFLTNIASLPPNMGILYCNNNHLTTLPSLPAYLSTLICDHNNLTSLPALPNSLTQLECYNNALTALPVLPNSLTELSCQENNITALPALPSSLQRLECQDNEFSSLPALPASLLYLFTAGCPLTSLPALPMSLLTLDCTYNQLTSLPDLPASLTILGCGHNQLNSLPDLPASITNLMCSENQLTSLPELPPNLTSLTCSDNQITCFNAFPSMITFYQITPNPFTCLPNYSPYMEASLLNYPLCDQNDPIHNPNDCPESASGVFGQVFDNVNNDCVNSGSDLMYVPVKLTDMMGNLVSSTVSMTNGTYYIPSGLGNYGVSVNTQALTPALQVNCPSSNSFSAAVTAQNSVVNAGDFGLNCAGFDLGVQSIVPVGPGFPGETHALHISAGDLTAQYNMSCASGISGEVTIAVTGPGTVSFLGTPSNVNGNSATYSIADFGVGPDYFTALVTTDTTAQAGDQFCVSVTVTTFAAGDLDPMNNIYNYCYNVVNSYDPNIKETYPEILSPSYHGELTYTIHFQNTGNAPAINIRLADVLDSHLDLKTFRIVDASDEYTYSVNVNSRLLSIRFPNIMLSDSASDPQGSIGFVQYRIKPNNGLTDGTIIENTANIYFDYNDPIVTNTTQNIVSSALGLNDFKQEDLKLYPNPAKNNVNFESEELIEQMEFYNLNGAKVMTVKPNTNKTQVDVSALQNGVYIVKVQSKSGVVNKRLVIHQ